MRIPKYVTHFIILKDYVETASHGFKERLLSSCAVQTNLLNA
jgi:hypothetical protein